MARRRKLSELLGSNAVARVPRKRAPSGPYQRNMNQTARAGGPPQLPRKRTAGRRGVSR